MKIKEKNKIDELRIDLFEFKEDAKKMGLKRLAIKWNISTTTARNIANVEGFAVIDDRKINKGRPKKIILIKK